MKPTQLHRIRDPRRGAIRSEIRSGENETNFHDSRQRRMSSCSSAERVHPDENERQDKTTTPQKAGHSNRVQQLQNYPSKETLTEGRFGIQSGKSM